MSRSGTGSGGHAAWADGCVPVPGGLVMALTHFDRILELDRANLCLLTEPGVTTLEIARKAEAHGIGLAKKAFLPRQFSPVEMALLATVKRALDPDGLLNPGKILDVSGARRP